MLYYEANAQKYGKSARGHWGKGFILYKRIQNLIKNLFQYGIVGGIAALVEWSSFYVSNQVIRWDYIPSTCIAFIMGTAVNFLLASRYIFKTSKYSRVSEISLIYLVSMVGLVFNLLLMKLFVDVLGIWPMYSKIMSTGIVFAWNFVSRRYIIYRNGKQIDRQAQAASEISILQSAVAAAGGNSLFYVGSAIEKQPSLTIEAFIAQNLHWDIGNADITYDESGLTNKNFIVNYETGKYVVRLSGENSMLLGVKREAEFSALKAVAAIGLCPELLYYDIDTGNMMTRFIEGKKWSTEEFKQPDVIAAVAEAMKKVHTLPYIGYSFSPYRDIEESLEAARTRNAALPIRLEEMLEKLYEIKAERDNGAGRLSLCHNDPFNNNFIFDGTVRLLDWEFAGMGDIFYDLACISCFYDKEQSRLMLETYFGYCDNTLVKTLEDMKYVVAFWNATWAILQAGLSENTSDYQAMANSMFSWMEACCNLNATAPACSLAMPHRPEATLSSPQR